MSRQSPSDLRQLPSVHELLASPGLADTIREHGRDIVRHWVRQVLDQARGLLAAREEDVPCGRDGWPAWVARAVGRQVEAEAHRRLERAINATGVVLHTGLGRAPLAAGAVRAIEQAAAACTLEIDPLTDERRTRGYQLQAAWRTLTGAEGALVVNNNAAATLLALDALCRGREVVLSRGQLIEIGGSFRLPEIFAHSGAILREVGTTNRTTLDDYERALGPNTAAILRVHPSNYRVVGFAETPEIGALAELARRQGVLCIDDIGSGCLIDTTQLGLPAEPTFSDSLSAGADLVLGSGDKLLGGPQCGILLGRGALIAKLSAHPLARALRIDKLTLAALSATLDCYVRGDALSEIPALALLAGSVEGLLVRAQQMKEQLAAPPLRKRGLGRVASRGDGGPNDARENQEADAPRAPSPLTVSVARDTSPVGGGSLPGVALPTAVLRLRHAQWSADELSRRLRLGRPRVFGRIHEGDVVLDLRSVLPEEDGDIVRAVVNQLTSEGP